MSGLVSLHPDELVARWLQEGRRRASFIFDRQSGRLCPSEPALEPLAVFLQSDERDFDDHDAVFLEIGAESRALMGAFLHRTIRGQGQGGLRNWRYDSVGGFLKDGLRLSRGMGRKCSLAGLWWGGGKGVLARPLGESDPALRRKLYEDYGRFITSLRGAYVTAEDVGTSAQDMVDVYRATRFVTCVPPALGGSGNPSGSTARGVVCAMEGALEFAGLGDLRDKTVAMQGLGHVGSAMVELLLARGVRRIVATDIDAQRVDAIRRRFPDAPLDLRQSVPGDQAILAEPCDVLAPNALGGVLHPETIPRIGARIVCGAANNQLLDDRRDDELLEQRGIIFVPDFVANRMGIVQCANEQYGSLSNDPAFDRHFSREWDGSVFRTTRRVLALAKERSLTPTRAANALADELSNEPHPIWGDRARAIITALGRERWYEQPLGPPS